MEQYPHRHVVVVAYDPQWPDLFQQETLVLRSLFSSNVVAIHHIGSTAIPGMHAKPIVDILVEVQALEPIEIATPGLMQLGYIPQGELGIPKRRFFIKGSETLRTHHLHVYPAGHPQIARHLAFRDYLCAHPVEAQVYSTLKAKLAQQFPDDLGGYIAGKDAWIKPTEQRALAWKARQER